MNKTMKSIAMAGLVSISATLGARGDIITLYPEPGTSGSYDAAVALVLDDAGAGVTISINVINKDAEITGLFLILDPFVNDAVVTGANVVGSSVKLIDNLVVNVGNGVNMQGTGLMFDLGMRLTDGIPSQLLTSTVVSVSSPTAEFDVYSFPVLGLRLQSAGPGGSSSSKMIALNPIRVPEPATLSLLSIGLLCLAGVRRRIRK